MNNFDRAINIRIVNILGEIQVWFSFSLNSNCSFIILNKTHDWWCKLEFTEKFKYARKMDPLTFVLISCFKPHQSKWVILKRIIWCGFLNICLWRSACIHSINPQVLDSTNSGQFSPFRKIHVSTMTRRCFKSTWSEIFVLVLFIIVSVCILTHGIDTQCKRIFHGKEISCNE